MSTRLSERIVLLGYTGGWSAVRHLPDRAAYGTFRRIADRVWRRRGPSVQRLEANLARALGTTDDDEVRAASRAGMRSYLRYWCDAFRQPDWDTERIVSRIRVEGEENMRAPLRAGRGVVAALPHMANWDHAGAWACLTGAPVTTVAERLKPEALFERFVAFREGLGMEILPLTGGKEDVFTTLAARLREPRLVPLLADRELSRRGVDVTLFGEATRMPAGPAALALRTGSALLPVSLWYEGTEPDHRLGLRFHEELTPSAGVRGAERIRRMTQDLADEFSRSIAAHAHDWHMLQPMFLADLPGDDPRRTVSSGASR
ncbi:MAG TPA: phosphatidylinositol mannoside acyltransferase [Jiangellaceae bacterium]|nr:phosphatidylinositol mannoside acyltransferase [Jiangellaceae bacterium]